MGTQPDWIIPFSHCKSPPILPQKAGVFCGRILCLRPMFIVDFFVCSVCNKAKGGMIMPNIKPVSDLRNYGKVLRDFAIGQPVFFDQKRTRQICCSGYRGVPSIRKTSGNAEIDTNIGIWPPFRRGAWLYGYRRCTCWTWVQIRWLKLYLHPR